MRSFPDWKGLNWKYKYSGWVLTLSINENLHLRIRYQFKCLIFIRILSNRNIDFFPVFILVLKKNYINAKEAYNSPLWIPWISYHQIHITFHLLNSSLLLTEKVCLLFNKSQSSSALGAFSFLYCKYHCTMPSLPPSLFHNLLIGVYTLGQFHL
jgi:hypothetical protein